MLYAIGLKGVALKMHESLVRAGLRVKWKKANLTRVGSNMGRDKSGGVVEGSGRVVMLKGLGETRGRCGS